VTKVDSIPVFFLLSVMNSSRLFMEISSLPSLGEKQAKKYNKEKNVTVILRSSENTLSTRLDVVME